MITLTLFTQYYQYIHNKRIDLIQKNGKKIVFCIIIVIRGGYMDLIQHVLEHKHITLKIDENFKIKGVSAYLQNTPFFDKVIDQSLSDVLQGLLYTKTFKNDRLITSLEHDFKEAFQTKQGLSDEFIVTNDYDINSHFYRFKVGIDVLYEKEQFLIFQLHDFEKKDAQTEIYDTMFETYHDEFSVIEKLRTIGTFVIDYSVSKDFIYANDQFAYLMNIQPNLSNYYLLDTKLNKKNNGTFIKNKEFLASLDVLESSKQTTFSNELQIGTTWIQLD
jgi:hypothetical protein